MNICLNAMTKELCREFYREFTMDPCLFANPSAYKPYVYQQSERDAYYERYRQLGRVHLVVMMAQEPIGELVFKNLDHAKRCCTMGITMKNDSFKNKGYGTEAEILALNYAFHELKMETVYADALVKNTRSQHVLQKVGFVQTHCDDTFVYYRADKHSWQCPDL